MPLSDRERAVLDLERTWWNGDVSKREAIRGGLGVSPAAYYAMLAGLVTRDDALAYDPLLIKRLRRRNAARRRLTFEPRALLGRRPQ